MRTLCTFVAALLLVVVSGEQADARHSPGDGMDGTRRHHGKLFPCLLGEYDTDGDGELSDEERAAAVADRRAEILAEYDVDGDGELSDDERAAAREGRQAEREARRAERLAAIDTDGDGEISDEEREAARAARLAEYDTDGDGELSDEEKAAARAARCDSGEMTEEEEALDVALEALAFSLDFIRGDMNQDGITDLSDPIFVLSFLFHGGRTPVCLDAADANDDGELDISDATAALGALFSGTGPLPPPSAAPGIDVTEDDLSCLGELSST